MMTDDKLNAKLARIDALMNNVAPGSPEAAEYLALIVEVQAEEDRRWTNYRRWLEMGDA